MKIQEQINGRKVCCLQSYEAVFLASSDLAVPDSLVRELFADGPINLGTVEDGYRFDRVVEDPANVAWLEAQDWIVDYQAYAQMPVNRLYEEISRIKKSFQAEVGEYNKGTRLQREMDYAIMGERIVQKRHEVRSLELLACYLNEEIDFVFPDEIYKEFRRGPARRFLDSILGAITPFHTQKNAS